MIWVFMVGFAPLQAMLTARRRESLTALRVILASHAVTAHLDLKELREFRWMQSGRYWYFLAPHDPHGSRPGQK